MRKTRHKFTPEEDEAILRMKREGKTFTAIAAVLLLPDSSIGTRCRLLLAGKRTPKAIRKASDTAPEPSAPSAPSPYMHHTWSAEDDRLILELRTAGKPWKEIGGAVGVSAGSASSRHGLLRARQDALKNGISGMVKCLGPDCGKQFLSPDRCRIRICPACKQRIATYATGTPTEHALRL